MIYTEKALPARVAVLMSERGVTQRQLGEALGLSQQAIHKSLNRQRRFSVADLCNLATYFDVTPGELLAGPDVLFTKGL